MNVKMVHFINGNEAIAEVTKDGDDVILKHPCILGMAGESQVAMAPLSPFAKCEKISISRQHVLFIDDPRLDIRNYYAEQHGGIAIPEGADITRLGG